MGRHARLSPSKAKQWFGCPGSVTLTEGVTDHYSRYAEEGTAAHHLAAHCLQGGTMPVEHLGRQIIVASGVAHWAETYTADVDAQVTVFEVTEEMAENVSAYVSKVRELANGADMFVEQRVDLSATLGAEGEGGTADVIIIGQDHYAVHDLKYGKGRPVYAKDNPQLYLYALGAYEHIVSLILDAPKFVTVGIHQPRIGGYDEYSLPFNELLTFAKAAREAAEKTRQPDAPLIPGPEQCEWCLGMRKAICPAVAQGVLSTVAASDVDEFVDLSGETLAPPETMNAVALAHALGKVDLIEEWCSAIRARATRLLQLGQSVPGYKLVAGRRGPRQWDKDRETEVVDYLLKKVRLKMNDIYSRKLISPTKVEKLVGPVQYKRLSEFTTQSAGSPAVVPESDPRPPIEPAVAELGEFENLKE